MIQREAEELARKALRIYKVGGNAALALVPELVDTIFDLIGEIEYLLDCQMGENL